MIEELQFGLLAVGLNPEEFIAGDSKSARGPCFLCGGHQRLLIFVDKPFPHWWIHCDMCYNEGWLDQFFPGIKADPDHPAEVRTSEQINKELRAGLEERVQAALSDRDVSAMHAAMGEEDREWWRSQGIPDDWQDFWNLGVISNKTIYNKKLDKTLTCKAYSIPKFDLGWKLVNIDYRIYDPPLGWGKYRPEPGIPPAPFLSRPDLERLDNDGLAIAMEGSKKAAVACIHLDGIQIIGLPSCSSWAGMEERLKEAKHVLLVLDPDAEKAASKLLTTIGTGHVIRVTLPTKIDDAFNLGALNKQAFWNLVKMSGRKT